MVYLFAVSCPLPFASGVQLKFDNLIAFTNLLKDFNSPLVHKMRIDLCALNLDMAEMVLNITKVKTGVEQVGRY